MNEKWLQNRSVRKLKWNRFQQLYTSRFSPNNTRSARWTQPIKRIPDLTGFSTLFIRMFIFYWHKQERELVAEADLSSKISENDFTHWDFSWKMADMVAQPDQWKQIRIKPVPATFSFGISTPSAVKCKSWLQNLIHNYSIPCLGVICRTLSYTNICLHHQSRWNVNISFK